jgi:soluble lytic murein transglycosylase-like protein
MSLFNIQDRIAHIDSYLKAIDSQLQTRFNPASSELQGPNFNDVLDHALNQTGEVTKQVQGVVKDNFTRLPENFEQYIETVSAEIGSAYNIEIPVNLVKSIIKQESGFNPNAVSHAGAQGLMQLMPATAKSLGVYNSMNPYQNVRGGIKYIAQLLNRFEGNLQKALAGYNAGPEAVARYGGIPPYKETQNYVQSIMKDFLRRENYQPVDTIA